MGIWLCVALVLSCADAKDESRRYCGEEDCYEVLGAKRSSTRAEIKKEYREAVLDAKYLNKKADPNNATAVKLENMNKLFDQQLTEAYEVLSNALLRSAYDYHLDHPDSKLMHDFHYWRALNQARILAKLSWVPKLLGGLLLLSLAQYLNDWKNYANQMGNIRVQPAFQGRVSAREKELAGTKKLSKDEKAKLHEQAEHDVFASDVQVDGAGCQRPAIRNTLMFQLPISLPRAAYAEARWFVLFKVLQQDYGEVDQTFVTRQALGIPQASWADIDEETRQALLARKLWDESNLRTFLEEEKDAERQGKKGLLTTFKRQVDRNMTNGHFGKAKEKVVGQAQR